MHCIPSIASKQLLQGDIHPLKRKSTLTYNTWVPIITPAPMILAILSWDTYASNFTETKHQFALIVWP